MTDEKMLSLRRQASRVAIRMIQLHCQRVREAMAANEVYVPVWIGDALHALDREVHVLSQGGAHASPLSPSSTGQVIGGVFDGARAPGEIEASR